jgi:hypothetical protein
MTATQTAILGTKVPTARILIWEAPFWVCLLLISLIPASKLPLLEYLGIPLRVSDLLVLAGGVIYGAAWLFTLGGSQKTLLPSRWILCTLLLFTLGALSLLGANLDSGDKSAMAYTLLLAASCPLQAAGLLSQYREKEVVGFVNRLVLMLAVICCIYTAESVFNLGLRSEEGRNLGLDFGIQRVRGPLFGPSTGYLILLPALGWAIYRILQGRRRSAVWLFSAASICAALLGLGSRAAIILLAGFVLLLALATRQLKKKVLILVLVVCSFGSMGAIIYSQADTQRLQSFEDSHRRETHFTALNILTANGVSGFLTGQGYGAIWPWYQRDALRANWIAVGDNTVATPYGISLYHCHSTILELVVEFGAAGLVWLAWTVAALWRLVWRSKEAGWRSYSLALAVSTFAFFFDLFLFKETRVNAIWWIFALSAFALQPKDQRKAGGFR